MIVLMFSLIIAVAVILATFMRRIRHATLALWVAGLGIGGIYLAVGAELLAIVQWIVSTLVAISFVFFSVMFGEYYSSPPKMSRNGNLMTALSILLGGAFLMVISLGIRDLPFDFFPKEVHPTDLKTIGKLLTQEHLLSLEVLALTLFLVLIGGGVVARVERVEKNEFKQQGGVL